jgi:hypothetical protein
MKSDVRPTQQFDHLAASGAHGAPYDENEDSL